MSTDEAEGSGARRFERLSQLLDEALDLPADARIHFAQRQAKVSLTDQRRGVEAGRPAQRDRDGAWSEAQDAPA